MEYIKIVPLAVGAAVVYGIVQDQVTARVCMEYFSVAHPDYFGTDDGSPRELVKGVLPYTESRTVFR